MATEARIPHRNRIPAATAFMMMAVAFFGFDTADAIFDFLIIGVVLNFIFTTPLAWITFWTWFKMRDVGMFDKVWRGVIMFFIGLLKGAPIIGSLFAWLPAWTLGTFIIIYMVRREDKQHNAKIDADARAEAKKLERKLARQNRESRDVQVQNQRIAAANEQASQNNEIEKEMVTSYNRYNEDLYGSSDNSIAPIQKAA